MCSRAVVLDDEDAGRPLFNPADQGRPAVTGSADRLDDFLGPVRGARDEKAARSLRVREDVPPPVRQVGRKRHLLTVARPVAVRCARDEPSFGQRRRLFEGPGRLR